MSRLRYRILFILAAFPLSVPPGFSQTLRPVPERFRHERHIIPGGPGPNRLLLDAAVLSGSNSFWQFSRQTTGSEREPMILAAGGLKDLRIYDGSNREVPYLTIIASCA